MKKKELLIIGGISFLTVITVKAISFSIERKKLLRAANDVVGNSPAAPVVTSPVPDEEIPTIVTGDEANASGQPNTNGGGIPAEQAKEFTAEQMEAYKRERESIQEKINGFKDRLKKLKRNPQNHEQALALKNSIALLQVKYRLT